MELTLVRKYENNKSFNVTAKNIFNTYPIYKLTSTTSSVSFLSL